MKLITSTQPHRPPAARQRWRRAAAACALAGAAGLPIVAGIAPAASAAAAPKGTVIAAETTPFGTALVVGSGAYAGYTLYMITSDHGHSFGCTATPVTTPLGKLLCAGPPDDQNAEWPAITTKGAPVAGPGVAQNLLGTVWRAGIGEQVTYAGHPLYLFDDGPGQITGEDWNEPSLPPWHGIWYLVSPSGRALPWAGTLTTTTIGGRKVLATLMLTAAGWEDFPVYSFSKDSPFHSACTGSCARAWPAMLTSGKPGLSGGLWPRKLGALRTPEGIQVSYGGKPLYLFSDEGIAKTATGYAATGSGNGVSAAGGTFWLVAA